MLNREDKADVKRHFGGKLANKVAKATNDDWTPASQMASEIKKGYRSNLIAQPSRAKDKALKSKTGSFDRMNKERKSQGFAPKKDRATKGMYDFFDKFD